MSEDPSDSRPSRAKRTWYAVTGVPLVEEAVQVRTTRPLTAEVAPTDPGGPGAPSTTVTAALFALLSM